LAFWKALNTYAEILQILVVVYDCYPVAYGWHSLSFLRGMQPTSETEKQMLDLMAIGQDMGAGFNPA
jgi:hypothetical protein